MPENLRNIDPPPPKPQNLHVLNCFCLFFMRYHLSPSEGGRLADGHMMSCCCCVDSLTTWRTAVRCLETYRCFSAQMQRWSLLCLNTPVIHGFVREQLRCMFPLWHLKMFRRTCYCMCAEVQKQNITASAHELPFSSASASNLRLLVSISVLLSQFSLHASKVNLCEDTERQIHL